MRATRQRSKQLRWMISIVLGLLLQISLVSFVQVAAADTQALGSNENGSISAKYQVNEAEKKIDWEVTMHQNASSEDRQMTFSVTGQDGLNSPTDVQMGGGNVQDQNGHKIGEVTKAERHYTAHFSTTYTPKPTGAVSLLVNYQIHKVGEQTDAVLAVDQPVKIDHTVLGASETPKAESESASQESKLTAATDDSSKSSSSSVAESKSVDKTSEKTDQSKTDAAQHSSGTDQKQTTKSERAWSATGEVAVNGEKQTDLAFSTNEDNGSYAIEKLNPDKKITFGVAGSGVMTLECRTKKDSGWHSVNSGWGASWNGSWQDLGGGDFSNPLEKLPLNPDGSLTFKVAEAQSDEIQFRIRGLIFDTLYSKKIKLTGTNNPFSLTVPKMDFGHIRQFGEVQLRQFKMALDNPNQRKFTLKATNQTTDSAQNNPFGRDSMMGFNESGIAFMNPGQAITLVNHQSTIKSELPFSVNVPLNTYSDGNYATDINWQLTLDD